MIRLGSFCTGYGGLDLAVAQVLDVEHVWHAEIDPDASKVLAAHWPDVPNHGDLRATDWSTVEPVDVLTAGFPCQPVSAAGRRKGTADERWLFDDIADAVGRMDPRPRMLVFENVRGLLTANSGDAMARVVHGLARLGYVGRYRVFRASDVGAPHRRERVFIVADLADTEEVGRRSTGLPVGEGAALAVAGLGSGPASGAGVTLLPTPTATHLQDDIDLGVWRARRDRMAARHGNGDGPPLGVAVRMLPTPRVTATRTGRTAILGSSSSPSIDQALELSRGELPRELQSLAEAPPSWRLLPTPTTGVSPNGHGRRGGRPGNGSQSGASIEALAPNLAGTWGPYAPAIQRWEQLTGRPAPDPTELGTKGQPRLSPLFVEWLLGLPAGHVTDHLARNAALRVLGNGVVPQQGAAALRLLGVSL